MKLTIGLEYFDMFQQQTLNTSERWDEREDSLLKYLAIGPYGEEIGYVFLDLFKNGRRYLRFVDASNIYDLRVHTSRPRLLGRLR